jgi:hypothetical protein
MKARLPDSLHPNRMESGAIQKASILAYLNRLSDLLWLFGRLLEARRGVDSSLRTGDARWGRGGSERGERARIHDPRHRVACWQVAVDRGTGRIVSDEGIRDGRDIGRAQALRAEACRDTGRLDETEISRAVIETLAESTCDGSWLLCSGLPPDRFLRDVL